LKLSLSLAKKRIKIFRETPQLWILEDKKFAYIQIPKVATRSIRLALCQSLDPTMSVTPNPKPQIKALEKHHSLHISPKAMRKRFSEYYISAIVRNPYQRLYSCYKDKVVNAAQKGIDNIFEPFGIEYGMPFHEFSEIICSIPDHQSDRHFRSQSSFLCHKDTLIPDFIGKFETLESDWQKLVKKFHLPQLEVRNNSSHAQSSSDHFDSSTFDIIYKRYQSDFINFNYLKEDQHQL
jgi:dermatan 4-sulfotransferase 1